MSFPNFLLVGVVIEVEGYRCAGMPQQLLNDFEPSTSSQGMGGKVVTELVAGIPSYPGSAAEPGNHLVGVAIVPYPLPALAGEKELGIVMASVEFSEEVSYWTCNRDLPPLVAFTQDGYLAPLEVDLTPAKGDHFGKPYAGIDEERHHQLCPGVLR